MGDRDTGLSWGISGQLAQVVVSKETLTQVGGDDSHKEVVFQLWPLQACHGVHSLVYKHTPYTQGLKRIINKIKYIRDTNK